MSQENRKDDISKKTVVYQLPGGDAITIRQNAPYQATDKDVLAMDIYYPPDQKRGLRLPAVVVVRILANLATDSGPKWPPVGA